MRDALHERYIQSASALSLDAAHRLLTARALVAATLVAITQAAGCVAAADIYAPCQLPAAPLALRAGWAVAAADTIGATPNAPGFPSLAPLRVEIGDRMPPGTDAVLPPHAVRHQDGIAELLAPATPGEAVRWPGDDADMARPLVVSGLRLTPARIAALRLSGIEEVPVRQPRLAIVAPAPDAQTDWLAAAAAAAGAVCTCGETLPAPGVAEMIVHLGSEGALPKMSARRVAVRPGESIFCGLDAASEVSLIGVAPRLEEMLAAWLLLIRPCLAALTADATVAAGARFKLTRKIVSAPGVADLVLLSRAVADGAVAWAPLATGDIPWQAIAAAEAWLVVPPESEGHAAGDEVVAEYF